jgi:hypothetical protein
MYVNLDTLPAGQAMYTLHLTMDEVGTARSAMSTEEIDLVAPRGLSRDELMNREETKQELKDTFGEPEWLDTRLVGLVNQSDGYVVYDAFKAGDETGKDDM